MCLSWQKSAAPHDGNADNREIFRGNVVVFHSNFLNTAGNCERVGAEVVAQRRALCLRNFDYAWQLRNALPQAPHKCRPSGIVVALLPEVQKHRRDALHFKSGIHCLRMVKSAQQQSCRQQQDHAHRDLRAHQRVAQKPPASFAGAGMSAIFLQRSVQVLSRMDSRSAISFCRTDARASKRLATFAHATSRTSPKAARITETTGVRISRSICLLKNVAVRIANEVVRPGCRRSIRPAMTPRSARTCSIVTPGCTRPSTASQLKLSSAMRSLHGSSAFCMVMGAQNELGIGSVPLNPGGAIPTTVYAVRFRMILLPTSDGWLANVPRHKSSLITTTAFPPGAAQSDSRNPRPCPGCSPRTSK